MTSDRTGQTIPWDVWGDILLFTPLADLRTVSKTCRTLRRLANIVFDMKWRRIAIRVATAWKNAGREGKTYGREYEECFRHIIFHRLYRFDPNDLLKPGTTYIPRLWATVPMWTSLPGTQRRLHTFASIRRIDVIDAIYVGGKEIRRIEIQCGGQTIHVSHHLGHDMVCLGLAYYIPVLATPGYDLKIHVIAKAVTVVDVREGMLDGPDRRALHHGIVRIRHAGRLLVFHSPSPVTVTTENQ